MHRTAQGLSGGGQSGQRCAGCLGGLLGHAAARIDAGLCVVEPEGVASNDSGFFNNGSSACRSALMARPLKLPPSLKTVAYKGAKRVWNPASGLAAAPATCSPQRRQGPGSPGPCVGQACAGPSVRQGAGDDLAHIVGQIGLGCHAGNGFAGCRAVGLGQFFQRSMTRARREATWGLIPSISITRSAQNT